MVLEITHQEVVGGGLDAEACWVIELALLVAFTSHRGQMFQVWSIEVLDPVITAIRNDYLLVLAVKGDAPWVFEFTSRIA